MHVQNAAWRATSGSVQQRPRVMHVVVGGDIGGAERLLVDIAKRPDATNVDHEIALFTPNRALAAFFADAGLVVHDRGHAPENPIAYLTRSLGPYEVAWLANLLIAQRSAIVHTHTFGSHVVGTRAALRTKLPQIRTEHDVAHYFDPSRSVFTRWAAARTTRFAAVSAHVKRIVVGTAPAVGSRMTVVRNGVDTSYWSPRAAQREGFSVAIVCRLTGWKRVDLAIAAAARAGVSLVVVGDGEERARLEKLAKHAGGAVRFVGHQPDPRPFIAAASAVLSTSRNEPLGLSVLEALSMERPVIAVAEGGIPEIVQDDKTGILVHDATPAALASAIARARADVTWSTEMAARARRFAVEHCSIETMCAGYSAIYDDLRSVHAEGIGR